jgi:hypothetical protein
MPPPGPVSPTAHAPPLAHFDAAFVVVGATVVDVEVVDVDVVDVVEVVEVVDVVDVVVGFTV